MGTVDRSQAESVVHEVERIRLTIFVVGYVTL
jgi:hypothetical protein